MTYYEVISIIRKENKAIMEYRLIVPGGDSLDRVIANAYKKGALSVKIKPISSECNAAIS